MWAAKLISSHGSAWNSLPTVSSAVSPCGMLPPFMNAPDPRERDAVKCEDMRHYAQRAVEFLESIDFKAFMADEKTQLAVIRCIEVIGEAAKLVSEPTRRRFPEIPWLMVMGTRNILAHQYGSVDLFKVHQIVKEHLPGLLSQLESAISTLEKEFGK